jgi:hypothetical protein
VRGRCPCDPSRSGFRRSSWCPRRRRVLTLSRPTKRIDLAQKPYRMSVTYANLPERLVVILGNGQTHVLNNNVGIRGIDPREGVRVRNTYIEISNIGIVSPIRANKSDYPQISISFEASYWNKLFRDHKVSSLVFYSDFIKNDFSILFTSEAGQAWHIPLKLSAQSTRPSDYSSDFVVLYQSVPLSADSGDVYVVIQFEPPSGIIPFPVRESAQTAARTESY